MRFYPFSGLSVRIAFPFLLFVALGSTALVFGLQLAAQHESEHVFRTLADANARFITSSRLPPNERVAEPLGHVLNMWMFFRRTGGVLVPAPEGSLAFHAARLERLHAEDGIIRLDSNLEAIAIPLKAGVDLLLARPTEHRLAFLSRPGTLAALGLFWGLSFALAWSVTRSVVQPLQMLASRLPSIEHDSEPSLPGMDRDDEIGRLARTYVETRNQLGIERERRREAERLALLGRMATGLAHEIHNPLSAIRLNVQLLQSTAGTEHGAALDVLLGESARIESLVNQWMFLARPAPPRVSRVRLDELIAKRVEAHRAQAAHARVELVQTLWETWIEVDARRIAQAVSNIILNAIQAMPSGGTLQIDGSGNGVVTFTDSGHGFSVKALQHYADLFYSEKEGGMGIGLSVSSEILKAHGGRIRVENGQEGGAVVSVELPLAETATDGSVIL